MTVGLIVRRKLVKKGLMVESVRENGWCEEEIVCWCVWLWEEKREERKKTAG